MVATDRHTQTHTHTDRQTHRRHAKNNFFGFSGPQNVNIHQNLEVDFLCKCNTFSILRIAEKENLFRKTAQYFLDTTYLRSRYNSIMVQDIEK